MSDTSNPEPLAEAVKVSFGKRKKSIISELADINSTLQRCVEALDRMTGVLEQLVALWVGGLEEFKKKTKVSVKA